MARLLGRAQSAGVRHGVDQLRAGAGERRCGGGPRRASPTLRQRAGPPPTSGETPASPALRGGTLDCPARPFGDSAPGARPGSACAARRRCAPGALEERPQARGVLNEGLPCGTWHIGHRGADTRTIAGNMRGAWRPTPTDRGIGSRRPEAPLKGCQRGCHLGRPSGGRCRLRRRPCLTWDLGAGC